MSLGVAFTTLLPTPGVTPSPTYEALDVARHQEIEAKLVAKVTDADIALTGGDVAVHGVRTFELPAAGATAPAGGATYDAATERWASAAGANVVNQAIPVQPGQRIRSVTVHGRNSGVAWVLTVHKKNKATEAITQLGTVSSGAVAGTIEAKTIALTEVVVAGWAYYLKWTSGAAADRYIGSSYGVDRP